MIPAKNHINEPARLSELNSYQIMDSLTEEDYDNLTAIASEICQTHIALISLIDDNRQWFKSHHGLGVSETPKDYAFCAHAIHDQDEIFIIEDSREDKRFHDNPLVTGDPRVIFYAGVPLVTENGLPLGTLCVIDDKPKQLNTDQLKSLKALGRQAMNLLELRKKKIELENAMTQLSQQNEDLEHFAYVAAHDIKSPLNNIIGLSDILLGDYKEGFHKKGIELLNYMKSSSQQLKSLVDGLLEYSRNQSVLQADKVWIEVKSFVSDLKKLISLKDNFEIKLNSEIEIITTNRTALEQILINLIVNGIKYNDKEKTIIKIALAETKTHYLFSVEDNGPGIAKEYQDRAFNIFHTGAQVDKYGKKGNGIGLATVTKLVKAQNGMIKIDSDTGEGLKINFSIGK